MKLGLSLVLFFFAMPAAAQSKSYDGKFAKQIYTQVQNYTNDHCTVGSCDAMIDQVRCSWSNGETPSDFECTYSSGGSDRKLKGAKAKSLVAMMQKYGKIDSDTSGKRAMFSSAQKVSCNHNKEEAKKELRYSCVISAAGSGRGPEPASLPPADDAKAPAPAKSESAPLPPADNDLIVPEVLDSKYSE